MKLAFVLKRFKDLETNAVEIGLRNQDIILDLINFTKLYIYFELDKTEEDEHGEPVWEQKYAIHYVRDRESYPDAILFPFQENKNYLLPLYLRYKFEENFVAIPDKQDREKRKKTIKERLKQFYFRDLSEEEIEDEVKKNIKPYYQIHDRYLNKTNTDNIFMWEKEIESNTSLLNQITNSINHKGLPIDLKETYFFLKTKKFEKVKSCKNKFLLFNSINELDIHDIQHWDIKFS